jgi:hypothetical protein
VLTRGGVVAVCVASAIGAVSLVETAQADTTDTGLYDRLWPETPVNGGLTLQERLTDHLTELGNTIGGTLNTLSYNNVNVSFDGRRRKAHMRVGTAAVDEKYLVFNVEADMHFVDGVGQVAAHLELGIAGHTIALELPEFDMAPAEYRGDYGVEIRVPLFKRQF